MTKSKIMRLALSKTAVVTILQLYIVIGLLIYSYDEQSYLQPDLDIYPACCALFALIIWSFWSWQIATKTLFDPYILFLTAASLFNGGQAILEVFHLNKNGFLEDRFSAETQLKTLFIVMLGLAAMHLGVLLSLAAAKIANSAFKSEQKSAISNERASYLVGLGLVSISFLPALITFSDSISVVLSSGYAGLYQREDATGLAATARILTIFMIPASLFLLAGSQKKFHGKVIAVGVIFTYATTYFFLGLRNAAIIPLIAFAWLWHCKIYRLPMLVLMSAGLFIMAVVSPLIEMTRNISGQERLSLDTLTNMFSSIENPIVTSISEMGFSMTTVAYTLDLVPKSQNFHMGADYFYALLTLMPNLFWKIHPTIARGTPTRWLIEHVNPWSAAQGFSYGFSFIAEAYLNFGWFGTPVALGILGFLLGKLRFWAVSSNDPGRVAMLASFTSFFLFYARADAALQVRPLVWFSLFPYLCTRMLSSISRRGAKL